MVALNILSIALLVAAAFHALRLARRTRWTCAWCCLAAALGLVSLSHALDLARLPEGGGSLANETVMLTAAGFLLVTTVLLGRSVQVAQNLTEAVRVAKESADLASQAKTNFLANMSHELRTPLNAVIGFAQVMRNEYLGPLGSARYREYAAGIEESGQHLLSLIEDILDVSHIEAGYLELREEELDPVQLMDSVVRLVRPKADTQRVMLYHEPGQDLPAVRADARRLRQVLLNLLSNAIRFTPAGGLVEVKGERAPDGGLSFTIRDTGIGIRAEDLERVMGLFGQAEGVYSRSHPGPGLGLPIAHGLMRLHGGTLTLESMADHGTTVRAVLPPERVLPAASADAAGQPG